MSFEKIVYVIYNSEPYESILDVVQWPIMHMVLELPTMLGLYTFKVDVPISNNNTNFIVCFISY